MQFTSFYFSNAELLQKVISSFGSLLQLAGYVLYSLALYQMAESRAIRNPWLAWVPVANIWILGSLSDQYRYVTRREIRSRRKVLLGLCITRAVLAAVLLGIVCAGAAAAFLQADFSVFLRIGFPILCLCLPLAVLGIWFFVLKAVVMYDVYSSCDPGNAVVYLVLSIVIPVTAPLFLFLCRNLELGMPPRRAQ